MRSKAGRGNPNGEKLSSTEAVLYFWAALDVQYQYYLRDKTDGTEAIYMKLGAQHRGLYYNSRSFHIEYCIRHHQENGDNMRGLNGSSCKSCSSAQDFKPDLMMTFAPEINDVEYRSFSDLWNPQANH